MRRSEHAAGPSGGAPSADTPRASFADAPRFAFAENAAHPARVNGNVAAVLRFLNTVIHDPEHAVTLDPVAASGLGHILAAAQDDLLAAAEGAEMQRGPSGA